MKFSFSLNDTVFRLHACLSLSTSTEYRTRLSLVRSELRVLVWVCCCGCMPLPESWLDVNKHLLDVSLAFDRRQINLTASSASIACAYTQIYVCSAKLCSALMKISQTEVYVSCKMYLRALLVRTKVWHFSSPLSISLRFFFISVSHYI